MVQKGKFFASAIDFCAMALKSVDLPTLGRPTSPTFIFIDGVHLLDDACALFDVWLWVAISALIDGMNDDQDSPFDGMKAAMHTSPKLNAGIFIIARRRRAMRQRSVSIT